MSNHIYLRSAKGDYFYRQYPKLPAVDREEYDASRETTFHGFFAGKEEEVIRKSIVYFVNMYTTGKMILYDDVLEKEIEKRDLHSGLKLEVTKEMFDHPFEVNKKYKIDLLKVTSLK